MDAVKEGAAPEREHENERAPLLLHSLAELASIWQPLFELAGVATATEVGSEAGFNTLPLARWLRERGGGLTVVDPAPTDEVAQAERDGELTAIRGLSPQALAEIPEADAYLLDGDHNYATLLGELEAIFGSGSAPLVILHDVGWPWARRDLYYSPESLDASQRHPHSYELGVAPGRAEAYSGGFRGEGEFAVAKTEGGPRNGVRTAVEDFISVYEGFEFRIVPSVFGLGVLYRSDAPFAAAVTEALTPYAGNPLLDRLERNRIELYLKVLELQDVLVDRDTALEALHGELAGLHERMQQEIAALAASRRTEQQMRGLFDARESERSARELALLQRVAELESARANAERERDEARAASATPTPSRLQSALNRLRS